MHIYYLGSQQKGLLIILPFYVIDTVSFQPHVQQVWQNVWHLCHWTCCFSVYLTMLHVMATVWQPQQGIEESQTKSYNHRWGSDKVKSSYIRPYQTSPRIIWHCLTLPNFLISLSSSSAVTCYILPFSSVQKAMLCVTDYLVEMIQ